MENNFKDKGACGVGLDWPPKSLERIRFSDFGSWFWGYILSLRHAPVQTANTNFDSDGRRNLNDSFKDA